MNIKQAFVIAVNLALGLLTVYIYTQSRRTHLLATTVNLSLRKQSVSYVSPWQVALHQFQLTLDRVRDKFINDFKSQVSKCVSCNKTTTVFDEFLNVRTQACIEESVKSKSISRPR
jgi:tRNA uridine 5-carbamoylmethylation protein Kti12